MTDGSSSAPATDVLGEANVTPGPVRLKLCSLLLEPGLSEVNERLHAVCSGYRTELGSHRFGVARTPVIEPTALQAWLMDQRDVEALASADTKSGFAFGVAVLTFVGFLFVFAHLGFASRLGLFGWLVASWTALVVLLWLSYRLLKPRPPCCENYMPVELPGEVVDALVRNSERKHRIHMASMIGGKLVGATAGGIVGGAAGKLLNAAGEKGVEQFTRFIPASTVEAVTAAMIACGVELPKLERTPPTVSNGRRQRPE